MKYSILSSDANGDVGGALQSMLLNKFPDLVAANEADVVIIPINRMANYQFNTTLRQIKKPYVLLDYLEYEWCCHPTRSHILGENTSDFVRYLGCDREWMRLDAFVKEHPPLLYFKRELLAADVTDTLKPVDWPCCVPLPAPQSEAEFTARPLQLFNCWGYSHPSRPRIHAEIFEAMASRAVEAVSDFAQLAARPNNGGRVWASIYSPYYIRKHILEILAAQSQAKIALSLPGAGIKCFRHAESPVNCVMLMANDNLAWSYPWEHKVNCLKLDLEQPALFSFLVENASDPAALYQIYLRSQETVAKYQVDAYIRNYLTPLIQEKL